MPEVRGPKRLLDVCLNFRRLHLADVANIFHGIAIDEDDVGQLSDGDRAT